MKIRNEKDLESLIQQCDPHTKSTPKSGLGERARAIAERDQKTRQLSLIVTAILMLVIGSWAAASVSVPVAVLKHAPSTDELDSQTARLADLDRELEEIQKALRRYQSSFHPLQEKLQAERLDRSQSLAATAQSRNHSAFHWLASATNLKTNTPNEQRQEQLSLLIETFPDTQAAQQAQLLIAKGQ